MIDLIAASLLGAGAFFFLAGTVGLLRFRDVYSRLHALTKADTLGLGLTAAGLLLHAESLSAALKLTLIWLLVIVSSAVVCYLIAGSARARDRQAGRTP